MRLGQGAEVSNHPEQPTGIFLKDKESLLSLNKGQEEENPKREKVGRPDAHSMTEALAGSLIYL